MENESGALSRVSGLFSARGYNIESLNVAPTEDETLSRMTIVTSGSNEVIEQIIKQLNKLVDVVKVLFAVVVSAFGSAAAHCLHFEGRRNRCFETGARLLLG